MDRNRSAAWMDGQAILPKRRQNSFRSTCPASSHRSYKSYRIYLAKNHSSRYPLSASLKLVLARNNKLFTAETDRLNTTAISSYESCS